MKPTEEQKKEAAEFINAGRDEKAECPNDESDCLNWSPGQLQSYILTKTAGMKPAQKFKFANGLIKRIKQAKKDANR